MLQQGDQLRSRSFFKCGDIRQWFTLVFNPQNAAHPQDGIQFFSGGMVGVVRRDVCFVLHNSPMHVGHVERAVGPVGQVYRPERFIR